MQQKIGVKY